MNLKKTNKSKLLAIAKDKGIAVDESMTKAQIYQAINKPPERNWVKAQQEVTNPRLRKEEPREMTDEVALKLRPYVCRGAFRTGMTKEKFEAGKALVRELGVEVKIPDEYKENTDGR